VRGAEDPEPACMRVFAGALTFGTLEATVPYPRVTTHRRAVVGGNVQGVASQLSSYAYSRTPLRDSRAQGAPMRSQRVSEI
jgi:hypothetical protein